MFKNPNDEKRLLDCIKSYIQEYEGKRVEVKVPNSWRAFVPGMKPLGENVSLDFHDKSIVGIYSTFGAKLEVEVDNFTIA